MSRFFEMRKAAAAARPLPLTIEQTSTVEDSSTVTTSSPEPGTVEQTSTVEQARTVEQTSRVDPARIPLLVQGKKPADLAPVWISLANRTTYEARKVRWVSIAQHAMTKGQESFYEALWKRTDPKIPVTITDRHRKQIRAGYDVLARHTRLTDRRVQTMIPQLIEKQILHSYHDADPNVRRGTLYDVFSYEEILRRQRAMGLCYVVKNGPGIEFAVPLGWAVEQTSTVELTSTDEDSSTGTVEETSVFTVEDSSTPIDSKEKTFFRQGTPPFFSQQVKSRMPFLTQDAIDQIWRDGHQVLPDVQSDELLGMLWRQFAIMQTRRGIVNPVATLLETIPVWVSRETR